MRSISWNEASETLHARYLGLRASEPCLRWSWTFLLGASLPDLREVAHQGQRRWTVRGVRRYGYRPKTVSSSVVRDQVPRQATWNTSRTNRATVAIAPFRGGEPPSREQSTADQDNKQPGGPSSQYAEAARNYSNNRSATFQIGRFAAVAGRAFPQVKPVFRAVQDPGGARKLSRKRARRGYRYRYLRRNVASRRDGQSNRVVSLQFETSAGRRKDHGVGAPVLDPDWRFQSGNGA